MRRCRAVFVTDAGQQYRCAEDKDATHLEHWAVVHGWNRPHAMLRWWRQKRKRKEVMSVAGKPKPKPPVKKPAPKKQPWT